RARLSAACGPDRAPRMMDATRDRRRRAGVQVHAATGAAVEETAGAAVRLSSTRLVLDSVADGAAERRDAEHVVDVVRAIGAECRAAREPVRADRVTAQQC